jgi:hypothetical protein
MRPNLTWPGRDEEGGKCELRIAPIRARRAGPVSDKDDGLHTDAALHRLVGIHRVQAEDQTA